MANNSEVDETKQILVICADITGYEKRNKKQIEIINFKPLFFWNKKKENTLKKKTEAKNYLYLRNFAEKKIEKNNKKKT